MGEKQRFGNRKNVIKWCLDLILITLFVLMFHKRVISMSFHEIGGLFLLGCMVLHIGLNYRFVITVTKKIFSKKIPGKTKLGYIVDVCLLILFVLIGVSGAMMSKVVFQFNGGNQWKIIHYTSSALALILIGIHVGLHWNYIKGIGKKIVPLPSKVSKPLGYIVMIAFLVFGGYSVVSSSFSQWISMPFGNSGSDRKGGPGFGDGSGMGQGNRPDRENGFGRGDGTGEGRENRIDKEDSSSNDQESRPSMEDGMENGKNDSIAYGGQFNENGMGGKMPNSKFSIATLCQVIATYLSIVAFFAILTYWIERLIHKGTSKNKVEIQGKIECNSREIPLIELKVNEIEEIVSNSSGMVDSGEEESAPQE